VEQPDASTVDGERKTVTALFADIKGSMELMEDLDPEEARAIVDPALKLMMDAPWPLSDATAKVWKANSPWRELSGLVKPDYRLRHIAASR
jgi:hypothetical protein